MRNIIFLFALIYVCVSCEKKRVEINGFPVKILHGGSSFGIITPDGNVLIDSLFSGKPSIVVNQVCVLPCGNGMFRLCDISKVPMTTSSRRFIQVGNFIEDVTIAQEEKEGPFILINKSSENIAVIDSYRGVPVRVMHNFKDGLALAYTGNQKYGYVNTRGEWVIAPEYDFACDFSEGMALVGMADREGRIAYEVIDREGQNVFPVMLTNCRLQGVFSCGLLVYKDLRQHYCACLDKKGKTVLYLPAEIQEMTEFRHDVAFCLTRNGIGVVDKAGKMIVPADYDDGEFINSERLALKSKGKWALFDFKGNRVTPFIYDKIYSWSYANRVFVHQDSVDLLIDRMGKTVSTAYPFELDWQSLETTSPVVQVFYRYPLPETVEVPEPENTILPAKKLSLPRKERIQAIDTASPFYQEAQKVLKNGFSETDSENRRVILNYMEHFRMSYETKDIDFLEQLFSEKALIIVGTVVKQLPQEGHYLPADQIRYNIKTKQQYLDRLRRIFKANKKIEVRYSDFLIRRHPTRPGIYGVSVRQAYSSDLYSDEGYLFLLWDFSDETAPKIHVRTWQPRRIDDQTLLPERDIIHLGSFNFE
ncbi:WG repeat-containing protein [Butyricimonas faecihominis]|uniref:WG repeat-containing protein n=1 Tax=Butyricimonas faecihominis TaxID=1472416 RepID=UPI0032C0AAA9